MRIYCVAFLFVCSTEEVILADDENESDYDGMILRFLLWCWCMYDFDFFYLSLFNHHCCVTD